MTDFSESDVVLIAQTFAYNAISHDYGQYSNAGWYCEYCMTKRASSKKEVKHTQHCPVLVAKDILTRCDE